jgi:hypothetical protein
MLNLYTPPLNRLRHWLSVIGCFILISNTFGVEGESLSELKARADNGEAEAQFTLGIKYEKVMT